MSSLLLCICLAIYALFATNFYIKARSKKAMIITSLLMGASFAILAYNFIPEISFDLTRHHVLSANLANIQSVTEAVDLFAENDLEIIPQLYSLLIGKIGDLNLLQSVVVLIGYSMLFYILIDYKNRKKTSTSAFLPIIFVTIFGQSMIYFFSGLYFYLASIIVAFAIYIDYVCKKKRLPCFLYILAPFIHISMVAPIAIVAILKIKKGTLSKKTIIILAIISAVLGELLNIISDMTGNSLFIGMGHTYNTYIVRNDWFSQYYSGAYMLTTVMKAAIVVLACYCQKKKNENSIIRNYLVTLLTVVTVMSISALAMTRFYSLALFISVPIMLDVASSKRRNSLLIMMIFSIVSLCFVIYNVYTLAPYIRF